MSFGRQFCKSKTDVNVRPDRRAFDDDELAECSTDQKQRTKQQVFGATESEPDGRHKHVDPASRTQVIELNSTYTAAHVVSDFDSSVKESLKSQMNMDGLLIEFDPNDPLHSLTEMPPIQFHVGGWLCNSCNAPLKSIKTSPKTPK